MDIGNHPTGTVDLGNAVKFILFVASNESQVVLIRFCFFFPSSLTEEQQWAESYSQQNPVASNGYSVTAEIQPQMPPDQTAQYEGIPVKMMK